MQIMNLLFNHIKSKKMKKQIISMLEQVTSVKVSERDAMGILFKNLGMLLTDVSMYLQENLGISLSPYEKEMVMSMSVEEFLGFLRRKLKERDMQDIANLLRRVGAVRPSTSVDAQDRISDLLDLEDEEKVADFLGAITEDFAFTPSEKEAANMLKMSLSELADFLNKIK